MRLFNPTHLYFRHKAIMLNIFVKRSWNVVTHCDTWLAF